MSAVEYPVPVPISRTLSPSLMPARSSIMTTMLGIVEDEVGAPTTVVPAASAGMPSTCVTHVWSE